MGVIANGSGPFSYQWQYELAGAPGVWTNLTDGAVVSVGTVAGSMASALAFSTIDASGNHFRCVATNTCGGVTSDPATLTIVTTGDMNCNCVVNNSDIGPFVLALLDPVGYAGAYPGCVLLHGDLNLDGVVDGRDISLFVAALLGP